MQPQCYNVPNNTPQTQFDVFDIELINASDDAKTISQNLFKKYKNSFNTLKVCTVNHMDNLEKAMNGAPKKRFQNIALELAKIRSIDSYFQENKIRFETRQRVKKQKRDIEWQEMRSNPDEFDAETIRILNIQMECDRDRMLNLRVKAMLIKFIKNHLDYVQVEQEHHQQMVADDHNWKIICQLAKTDSCTDQEEIDYLNSLLISYA